MKELRCRKGLKIQVLKANGYYIGTLEEEGDMEGCPNCRCSGYYKTQESAQNALDSMTFDRICAENSFCNQGMGCLIKDIKRLDELNITADNEWRLDELKDILFSECKRQCAKIDFLMEDMTYAMPQVVADKFIEEYNLIEEYNKINKFDIFDNWMRSAVAKWITDHKSKLYVK